MKNTRENIKRVIQNWWLVGVKYVPISKKDGFILFKQPGVHPYVGMDHPEGGSLLEVLIIHGDKVINTIDEQLEYFMKYDKKIIEAPEFVYQSMAAYNKETLKNLSKIKSLARKIGKLSETRGKGKKIDKVKRDRNKFIINEYKRIVRTRKAERPYPIKILQRKWSDKIRKELSTKDYMKYIVSDATIRRILDNCTKK